MSNPVASHSYPFAVSVGGQFHGTVAGEGLAGNEIVGAGIVSCLGLGEVVVRAISP